MISTGKYSIIVIIAIMMILSSSRFSLSSDLQVPNVENNDFFQPVIEKLLKAGADTGFVKKIINSPKTEFNERFVRINVVGYLKPADYSSHYNSQSVSRTKDFLKSNASILELAELRYDVPKEVIASVLWVETKHGGFLGNSNVVSVYLSTAMANEQKFIDMNIQSLKEKHKGDQEEFKKLEQKIYERANKKANWAIEQLLALEKIDKKTDISALELKGSWAGAFGISQFIPSSYVTWAVDGDNDGKVDLFNMTDAIFSVANYLKSNGWASDEEAQRSAVFHYNNSNAYVDAVLKLASLAKPSEDSQSKVNPEEFQEIKMQAQSGGDK